MSRIREVWAPNLDAEMRNIRNLIDQYPFIAVVRRHPVYPLLLADFCTLHRTPNFLE